MNQGIISIILILALIIPTFGDTESFSSNVQFMDNSKENSSFFNNFEDNYIFNKNLVDSLFACPQIETTSDLVANELGSVNITNSSEIDNRFFVDNTEQYKFDFSWGSFGQGEGQFDTILGIVSDGSDNIYVTDFQLGRVQKFSSAGKFITKWGTFGRGEGQFFAPTGITIDSQRRIIVVDNDRIQRFTSSEQFYDSWETKTAGWGVAVDSSSNVYLVDAHYFQIKKYNPSGKLIKTWGSKGSGNGQFSTPLGIAIDKSNNVYVTDQDLNRVQKFSSSGHFITKWGSLGSGNGQFDTPFDIATDTDGNVYVMDTNNNRVQKFSSSGQFITKWGSPGKKNGQFITPSAIEVDSQGNVYVADTGNHRISKFSKIKNTPTIEQIKPTYAYQGDNITYQISGTNLKGVRYINFFFNENEKIKSILTYNGDKKLEGFLLIPKNITPGLYNVELQDSNKKIICLKYEVFTIIKKETPISGQLAAYYSFDDGYAKDDSGKRKDGLVQGAKPTLGVKRNALRFNGKSDYISLPAIFSSNPKKITMMSWVKPKTDGRPQKIIYNGNYESALSINKDSQGNFNSGVKLSKDGSRNTWYKAQTNVTLNQDWVHITGVIDTDNHLIKTYQNGVLVSQNSLPDDTFYSPKDGRVRIAAYESSTLGLKEFFDGDIDEVRIYKGALTDSEIRTIYDSYGYGPTPTPTPTGSPTPTVGPTQTPDPNPLDASFTASPLSGNAPLNVQFTDTSKGNPTSWSWTFGDGGTAWRENPIHSYKKGGSYTVKLIVKREGKSSQKIMSNYVKVSMVGSKNIQFDKMAPLMEFEESSIQGGIIGTDPQSGISVTPPLISIPKIAIIDIG